MKNMLADTLSPYLLQHKDNPVHWFPWCQQAFVEALEQDKPIFLSIGYSACHWCHVMAHESFEDPHIADVLNKHFVSIKVDREQHPEIDKIYMDAVIAMHGHGGWPLTVFLTPQAKPFFGGTYFPDKPRYGQVSFAQLLDSVIFAWQQQRNDIETAANEIVTAMRHSLAPQPAELLTIADFAQFQENIISKMDPVRGGFKGKPKFPQVSLWYWLSVLGAATKNTELVNHCYLTAEKLCLGGIYDHVRGGWMRYSTDENWLVPHFEKMLYDNALLIEWLAELHATKPNPVFKHNITQTIHWLCNEMLLQEGVFASSLDADSEGVEGKYYVWSYAELETILQDKLSEFSEFFAISPQGNWEGKIILQRLKAADLTPNIKQSLELLNAAQSQRIPPARDDKVNSQWNALLIAALAYAGLNLAQKSWVKLAENTYHKLHNLLFVNGEWKHCYRAGKYSDNLLLDDYAAVIHALLALAAATGNESYLDAAQQHTTFVFNNFYNKDNHLFNQCAQAGTELIFNPQVCQDNATPSANGLMARNLATLYLLTGKDQYQQQLANMFGTLQQFLHTEHCHFFSYMSLAAVLLEKGVILKTGLGKIPAACKQILLENKPMLVRLYEDGAEHLQACDAHNCQLIGLEAADLREFLD